MIAVAGAVAEHVWRDDADFLRSEGEWGLARRSHSQPDRLACFCLPTGLGYANYGIVSIGASRVKPLFWIGSSRKDLCEFPEDVQSEAGFALYLAQKGDKALNAVPMMGFGSAKVLEVVIDNIGNTYRAVYTVKFAKAVYVLHAFQKKSRKGVATPKPDIDLIRRRLAAAEQDYRALLEQPSQRRPVHGKAK